MNVINLYLWVFNLVVLNMTLKFIDVKKKMLYFYYIKMFGITRFYEN